MTPHKHFIGALTFLAAMSVVALSACHTVEGAGKDIESTGEAIQEAADH